ncbi:MAG: hypothetical protein KJO66_02050 [Gammaproteobacteria bacterium]|nr:hypothetical protein [Gammaproteobacteria bacterium]
MNKITLALVSVSARSGSTEFVLSPYTKGIEMLSTGGGASGRVRNAHPGVT